ncbi:MAG: hypothetical protein ACM3U0_01315 [archaeon]
MDTEKKLLCVFFNPETPAEAVEECLLTLFRRDFRDSLNRMIADAVSELVYRSRNITPYAAMELLKGKLPPGDFLKCTGYLNELCSVSQRHYDLIRCRITFPGVVSGGETRYPLLMIRHLKRLTQLLRMRTRKDLFINYCEKES